MKRISRGVKLIAADSKEWLVTEKDYLPGGILTIIFEKCGPLIQNKTVKTSDEDRSNKTMSQEESDEGYNQYTHNSIYEACTEYSGSEGARKRRLVLTKQTDKYTKDEHMVYETIISIEAVINK